MRNYLKYIGFLIGAILTESANAQKSLLFFPNGGESILYANVDSLSHDNNEKGRPVNKIHSNGRVYQITVDDLDSITIDHTQKYRNWQEIINYPTRREIEDYNKSSKSRSPYLCAWLDTNIEGNFSQLAIDFKADYLPSGTYCSLANFYLNYGSLKEEDCKISRDTQISGYAGFQRQQNGDVYNSILSLWNVYCEYSNGIKDTIKAKLILPEGEKAIPFSHEGNGVSYRPNFRWKPRRWYRLLLQCGKSSVTGNTTLEQWAYDLSEKIWNKICVFDLGAPDITFQGRTAVFLENFQIETSGEIRSLEFKNARVFSRETNQWVNIESAYISQNSNYPGSYQYGADETTFWMITCGVPGCASPQDAIKVSVRNEESGSPY